MKKKLSNAEIIKNYRILKSLKSRSDVVPGDINIYWSLTINLETMLKHIEKIELVVKEVIDSYFTEENSHIINDNGNEVKVFNDDVRETMTEKLNIEFAKIDNKLVELDFDEIPTDSINEMLKQNEKTLSMAEIGALCIFIDK